MKQTAGRKGLGDLAPKFAELNDDILFGEVWSRTDKLSLRDRCMITVVALISKGITDNSLKYHLKNAKDHGITKVEMVEIVTHIAFYIGWPNAWAVFPLVREIYSDETIGKEPMFGLGKPNDAYAKFFVGKSYLNPLNSTGLSINNVTFEPGCRNNYHIHHAKKGGGQILLCTDGEGYYKEEGKEVRKLFPGDVVYIAPNVKHWHGATKDSWFSHIAIEVPGEECSNEWLEPVSDEEYLNLKQ
ncbi:MAG: carboxymuconolactone decarboxylase family protein [Firmicutes bacterium]|uniref:Carboxymuconolactone decarboxylase family protein n=1 Tax=Candidatus Onthovivens merdipullorum TaxID=2840889 RepID=A0A9D9GUL5_9BACL|nr:carboxymuconolactone decarboxylase family protein [Candidatus Onthovivens merdipullorum]